jgi:hypothetical protein
MNAIQYDEKARHFLFDGFPVRVETLGRLVANALVQGAGYIDFDRQPRISFERYDRDDKRAVSVNYVQQMLGFVGTHGWFWDCLDTTGDHAFDNTSPTPGSRWAEAQELFKQAKEGFQAASNLFAYANSRESSPVEKRRARRDGRREQSESRQLQIAGYLRLMPGVSQPPVELR